MLSTAAEFTLIVAHLRTAVANFLARQARAPMVVLLGTQAFVQLVPPSRHTPIAPETWQLLLHRIAGIARRFDALVQRWRAGTLPASRPRGANPERAGRVTRPPYLRLPRERGWINKRIPEAAPCAGRLGSLLQGEEWPQFLAEVPRAGRLLRPLCRALGVDLPPSMRLPPRPPRSRPRTPRPRQSHPTPVPGPPDRPIPAYVLAAARAWKKRGR